MQGINNLSAGSSSAALGALPSFSVDSSSGDKQKGHYKSVPSKIKSKSPLLSQISSFCSLNARQKQFTYSVSPVFHPSQEHCSLRAGGSTHESRVCSGASSLQSPKREPLLQSHAHSQVHPPVVSVKPSSRMDTKSPRSTLAKPGVPTQAGL